MSDAPPPPLRISEATADLWADFEDLLGPERGGSGGCWCMLWRLKKKEHDALGKAGRKAAIAARFEDPVPPGLLAYQGDAPAGWISVAPRGEFPRLEGSRVLQPVDDAPVWSVTCFFIAKTARGAGLSTALLTEACAFVRRRGGAIIEGYPIEPERPNYPPAYAWVGLAAAFRAAGFQEVARRSPTRPIMRRTL